MTDYFDQNPFASFAIIGANSIGENKENTKRFRVYRRVMQNKFSPVQFNHFVLVKNSCYLMINTDNSEPLLLDNIETMFKRVMGNDLKE